VMAVGMRWKIAGLFLHQGRWRRDSPAGRQGRLHARGHLASGPCTLIRSSWGRRRIDHTVAIFDGHGENSPEPTLKFPQPARAFAVCLALALGIDTRCFLPPIADSGLSRETNPLQADQSHSSSCWLAVPVAAFRNRSSLFAALSIQSKYR